MDKRPRQPDSKLFSDGLIKLFILLSIYQFVLHLYFVLSANDPRLIIPTIIAFLHDVALLSIITAIGYSISIFFSIQRRNIINKAFSVILIVNGILLSIYPKNLRELMVFPVNVFNSDINSAKTLLLDYLGSAALIPCLIPLILGVIVFRIKMEFNISIKVKILSLIVILFILGFTLKRPSPQPLMFSFQEEVKSLIKGEKRTVASLNKSATNEFSGQIKQLGYTSNDISNYNHVIMIVLEGVTAESFENEFLIIPKGYYAQHRNMSVYYNNYFASNLDSYTSLIAMLTSIQVPYRAYADVSLYNRVNTEKSITKDLYNRGFKNFFISCYQYQPHVPTRKYWHKIYERKDLPSFENWLSLGSNRMEFATEDKAAISTIIDIAKSNRNSFILHEMVYGHSPEWRAKTGKTENVYYSEYLIELSKKLKEENLFEETLFIIVSDHGDRAKSSDIENYRIPLLIVGKNNNCQTRNEWLSHLELPKIIYHYTAGDKHPEPRNELFLVGSTEKWVYGKMINNRNNLFIDDASGIVLSQSWDLKASEIRDEFQQYINAFNEKYGKR